MQIKIFDFKIFLNLPYKEMLVLIILLVAMIIAYLIMIKLRKNRVIKFGNFATLKKIEGEKRFFMSPILLVTKLLILTLLFLVATHSLEVNIMKPIATSDFVVAIDSSSSMLTPDYEPNRLDFAKQSALDWLDFLPSSTNVGVISFAGNISIEKKPTTNIYAVKNAIKNIQLNSQPGTAIGDAIIWSAALLNTSNRQRMVILITDGENNAGIDLKNAVEAVTAQKTIVYPIGIGNNSKTLDFYSEIETKIMESDLLRKKGITYTPSTTIPSVNETQLQFIANQTGGKYYVINTEETAKEAFESIIFKNERIELDSAYYILLFIAILTIIEVVLFSKYGAI